MIIPTRTPIHLERDPQAIIRRIRQYVPMGDGEALTQATRLIREAAAAKRGPLAPPSVRYRTFRTVR